MDRIDRFRATGDPYAGSSDPHSAGNGSTPGTARLADGSWQSRQREELRGSGYVVASLEAALWCFAHADGFEAAVLAAANLGDDADTTAAICGQLAGAHYGLSGIPASWRRRVTRAGEIEALADRLYGTA